MRLTLRTLLSYLDDQLEASAAKEIGQKLAETPAAQQLVSRIREVTRRRRLTAPPLAGDDVDPNTMAEYLDNLLPSEVLGQLEALCLESDVHLAEAAAAHQILTLIGQPANVSDAARRRMYELVHGSESVPAERRVPASPAGRDGHGPPVLSTRPLAARFWTGAAGLVGVIGTVLLVWVTLNVGNNEEGAPGVVTVPEADDHFRPRVVRPEDTELAVPELPSVEPAAAMPDRAATVESNVPETPLRAEADPVTVPPSDAADRANRTEESKSEPVAVQPARREPVTTEPMPEPAATPPIPKPAPTLANYVSTSGVLLERNHADREWRRLRTKSEITSDDSILCLPWYRANVRLANGAGLELVGETELQLIPPEQGVDAQFRLDRGRVLLSTEHARATFVVQSPDQTWRVTMPGPELSIGLRSASNWRPGGPFLHELVLVVPRGEVEVVAGETSVTVGGPAQLRWSSSAGLQEKEALPNPPAWMEKEDRTLLEARAIASLENALPFDGSILRPLIDATEEKNRESRLLAVQCLLAVGRLSALIDAMNSMGPGSRDVRQLAIHSLRQYMARGKEHERQVWQALFQKFSQSQEDADGVLGLLRGYSDAEFDEKRPEDYENLINLLSEDRDIAIRELAIMNLEELAGKPMNLNYSPDKPREPDIAGWRRALKDGQLPPKMRGKM